MAAVAYGYMALLGAGTVIAIILGAVSGLIFKNSKSGLAVAVFTVVGMYLIVGVLILGLSWLGVAPFVVPPLILSFMLSTVTISLLNVSGKLHPVWSIFLTLSVVLAAGVVYILLLRVNLWMAFCVATVMDIYLIFMAARRWKRVIAV